MVLAISWKLSMRVRCLPSLVVSGQFGSCFALGTLPVFSLHSNVSAELTVSKIVALDATITRTRGKGGKTTESRPKDSFRWLCSLPVCFLLVSLCLNAQALKVATQRSQWTEKIQSNRKDWIKKKGGGGGGRRVTGPETGTKMCNTTARAGQFLFAGAVALFLSFLFGSGPLPFLSRVHGFCFCFALFFVLLPEALCVRAPPLAFAHALWFAQ